MDILDLMKVVYMLDNQHAYIVDMANRHGNVENDEYGEKFQNRAFLFHSELTLFFKAASTTGRLLMTAATTGAPTPRRGTRLKLSAGRKTVIWLPSLRRQSTDICWRE